MNTAKESVIDKLSEIPDDLQNEFEVLESLYKLMKLENSKISVETEGTLSTNEAKEYFANMHSKESIFI